MTVNWERRDENVDHRDEEHGNEHEFIAQVRVWMLRVVIFDVIVITSLADPY